MNKRIAIQMDKIQNIDFDFDSSFMICFEAQLRGYEIFYYNPEDLYYESNEVKAKGYFIKLINNKDNYFKYLSIKQSLILKQFKFIFLRQDPPFNMNYITSTYLLDLLPKSTIVINDPTSVRNSTEKIFSLLFKEYMAPTIITQEVKELKNFLKNEKDIITKPLYGNGGEGINRSNKGSLKGINIKNEYLELPIMAQKYLPEVSMGDRRIILIDGEYIGSVARIPLPGNILANFHAGGKAKKTGLVYRDKKIVEVVKSELKKKNLFFVGIDIIGNFLTEINVTSPTGIKQINALNNTNVEKIFWDKLEAKYNLV